jgi:NO-binding membrane sensor protein with MHYT domain
MNYSCRYVVSNIVGSIIIAIAVTNIAVVFFFRLREKWDDAFWKRVCCALLLAGAGSGMHWTAATGTSFIPIPGAADPSSGKWTVVVVAVIVCPHTCSGN